uniref:Mediator of DNA damage checkpoint protein 1 n=1 Tax=Amphilophus citrinellus TaxID=61819 RepID=A0A3Q0SAP5_AMPCI
GMDATQMISDSILASDEEDNEEETENKRGRPLAKLCILKNKHIPETEFPLFLGDNVLGRDPNSCTLPLPASSVSKQHATICLSVYRRHGYHSEVDMEALVWDLGSMNGTRKGRLKLTPNVRYALSDGDSLVVADIPCHFVSCGVDPSQGDTRTPVRRNSGVQPRLPDASGEKGDDTSTDSNKCVNGGAETPVRTSCLTFEQTPHQPQGTLVPESDSDSDSEKGGRGERRPKALVSDSDSHKSSPSCSSFLSPQTKIVPERENERAAQGGTESTKGEQRVPVKKESSASLTGDNELSTPAVSTDAIPAFNMDSDTDVEGEEEGVASAGTVTLNTNQQVDQPPNTVQFHMNSDTDIDKDDDASGKAPKSLPSPDKNAKTSHVVPVIQPEAITMDSDTDVDDDDDDDAVVSDAATKTEPTLFQSAQTDDSAPSVQPKDFHLDSDTDVDEKEEEELTAPKSANVAPDSLQLESDTDDEAFPATSKPSVVVAVAESRATADAGADLEIRSDSDTDVEDESPLVIPVAVTTLSVSPSPTSEAFQADSDADTDVDESSAPPAGGEANADDLRVDGDAEDRKSDIGEAGEDQIPRLHKENTPGQEDEDFAVAETQSFTFQSRDRQSSEEPTQAFVLETSCDNKNDRSTRGESFQLGLSDSSHLRCPDGALAMESTQAFVSVEGGVNLEDTQAYADILAADGSSAENDLNLEAAQDHEEHEETEKCSVVSEKEGQVDLALEATQAYITDLHSDPEDDTDEDETQNMATSETKPSDFATSSTLAIAETQPMLPIVEDDSLATENPVCSVQQIEPRPQKEDGTKAAQPQEKPLSDAQSVTETQPMCMSDNEESDEDSFPAQRKRTANKLPVKKVQTCDLTCSELSLSETQPMAACEDDDEDSMPGPRKRKAKQLHLEEEETQQLTNSELSAAEPQRMTTCEDDDEDSMPGPRKRKAKQLHLDEEETQPLASSEVSALETQPLGTCEVQQSDEEDGIACPRKRKTKPLQLEEEQTQPLTSTDVETLAGVTGKSKKSDDVASVLGPQKRKAKQIKLKEEETQKLVKSDVSAIETRPLKTKTRLSSSEESEVGTSGACVPNLRVTRAKLREEEEQAECSAHSKRQTRGRRGKPLSDDDNKEKVKQAKQVRGKKMKQQKHDGEEEDENPGRERNKHAASKSLIKEQEEGKMREEKDAADLRQERENDKERSIDEREREQDEMERQHRTEDDKLENERRANEQERLQDEKNARAEGEEKPEREIKEKEERIGSEKLETEVERLERERKEQEKEMAKRELIERLEREEKEEREKLEKEKEAKEKELQEKREEQDKSKTPARGRRAARRTIASQCTTEPEQDSTVSTNDDFPARRTRSRSNSSNSVSSERSASSVSTQDSKGRGRGRGRGTKRTSEPPQTPISRSSHRRTTVAAGTTEQESNSSISLNSEISSCSVSFQNRGRGGRQRGRGRKTEHDPDSIPSISQSQSDHKSTPITTARGRKSKKAEDCSNDKEQSKQACATDESLISKSNVRGRGQRAVKSETVVRPVAPTVIDLRLSLLQVLFTGVVDEAGEKVLARLGGSMAKGVADMTCLVTDKVRRTVKFLCALAKGVPIVTTDWLEKSGKAGSFLSPTAFIVKDPEQENKFNFSLHESLRIASSQPLLEGYEVHVTKSVKPEPVHMKNIISSSGATFLPKMPSSNKPHTVVISCEEDWPLCRPALSASLPVVTAEFILTGILQQKLDFQSHTLSLSTANVQPAGGRGRGRRQT